MFALPITNINPALRQPQSYETPRNGYTPALQEPSDRMAIRNTPTNAYVSAEMREFLNNPYHRRRTVRFADPRREDTNPRKVTEGASRALYCQ